MCKESHRYFLAIEMQHMYRNPYTKLHIGYSFLAWEYKQAYINFDIEPNNNEIFSYRFDNILQPYFRSEDVLMIVTLPYNTSITWNFVSFHSSWLTSTKQRHITNANFLEMLTILIKSLPMDSMKEFIFSLQAQSTKCDRTIFLSKISTKCHEDKYHVFQDTLIYYIANNYHVEVIYTINAIQ